MSYERCEECPHDCTDRCQFDVQADAEVAEFERQFNQRGRTSQ